MIYIRTNKEERLCGTWEEVHACTFSPEVETIEVIDFQVHGKTYKERQASLRNQAVAWSYATPTISWWEVAEIEHYFRKNGRRYGLLKEFQENGIC